MTGSSPSAQNPQVSVLMTSYKSADTLAAAIQSILDQSFTELEIVYIEDHSPDHTLEVLKKFTDSRLRVITPSTRLGLVRCLNFGVSQARAPWIARMDCDDISAPDRLEKQMHFLKEHPDHVLVGTFSQVVQKESGRVSLSPRAVEDQAIRKAMSWVNPIVHGSVVYSKAAFERAGCYDEAITARNGGSEDFDLWLRLLKQGKAHNLPEYLYTRIESQAGLTWNTSTWAMVKRHVGIGLSAIRAFHLPRYYALRLIFPAVAIPVFKSGLLNKERLHQWIARRK